MNNSKRNYEKGKSHQLNQNKMSIKINAMVDDVKANNKDYKIMPKKIIQQYLVWKFKCSKYLANQAIKKLLENEETT